MVSVNFGVDEPVPSPGTFDVPILRMGSFAPPAEDWIHLNALQMDVRIAG